jgi:hypothetical protein
MTNEGSPVTNLAGNNRFLFMPHSPGVYLALLLKDAKDIEEEAYQSLDLIDKQSSAESLAISESQSNKSKSKPVSRNFINNYLFLDLSSLSKSFQTILNSF